MTCSRIAVPVLAAVAVVGVARAQPADDARYVIGPGAEPLFSDMLGSGQTLPGGCMLGSGDIEPTSVVATYTCGAGPPVVLELLHPDAGPPGGIRTRRFAVTVKSGAPPAGLVDAVADRIRAREAGFEWATAGVRPPGRPPTRWPAMATAAVVAILVLWALRRFTAARRAG